MAFTNDKMYCFIKLVFLDEGQADASMGALMAAPLAELLNETLRSHLFPGEYIVIASVDARGTVRKEQEYTQRENGVYEVKQGSPVSASMLRDVILETLKTDPHVVNLILSDLANRIPEFFRPIPGRSAAGSAAQSGSQCSRTRSGPNVDKPAPGQSGSESTDLQSRSEF